MAISYDCCSIVVHNEFQLFIQTKNLARLLFLSSELFSLILKCSLYQSDSKLYDFWL